MAMSIARELLRRYPALRSTWPVERAREWRQRQGWREHPRRMASWYRDMPDMHTRLNMSNLEMPEAAHLCQPADINVQLFDPDGTVIASKRFHLRRNGSLMIELHDLLPSSWQDRLASGQITLDFEGLHLGSSRAYLHWYNDRCLTSSHEKFGLTIPAVGGYWTVPNVQHADDYRVHLAIANLDSQPYTSTITLKDADGQARETEVELAVGGSRFVSLDALFEDPAGFLGDRPGVLYFGNNRQPAMYYYFVENARLGTWRAQHL